ncbi:hypothetical protein, partial [uncultured Thiocystis sp.]|uniref:hypothetical protein n=1 Tax=uncultured Thiocystis sp. TaxID=1202134 RepID=UPI0025FC9421
SIWKEKPRNQVVEGICRKEVKPIVALQAQSIQGFPVRKSDFPMCGYIIKLLIYIIYIAQLN